MRNFAALTIAVLPLVLAHVSPLDRAHQERHHGLRERQLLPILDEDNSSVAVPVPSPSVRPTTTTRDAISSAVSTSSGRTTSAIRTTSPPPVSVPSGVSTGTAAPTISGSGAGNGTVSGVVPSGNATASGSLNVTSSAPPSSSSAPSSASASLSQVLHTSMDEGGRVVIVTQYYTPSAVSTAASTSMTASTEKKDGPALSIGAIIGISIAVGVVILALIGCALWRMKRRNGDEDEAIRWPELNRHGDSDAHHALPARATGKHGIETDELERSLSNSSEVYMSQTGGRPVSMPMALNGSNFGAASSLDYPYEKDLPEPAAAPALIGSHPHDSYGAAAAATPGGYDYHRHPYPSPAQAYDQDDYTSFPPAVGMQPTPSQGGAGQGLYESDSEGDHGMARSNKGADGPPVYRA